MNGADIERLAENIRECIGTEYLTVDEFREAIENLDTLLSLARIGLEAVYSTRLSSVREGIPLDTLADEYANKHGITAKDALERIFNRRQHGDGAKRGDGEEGGDDN